MSENNGDPDGEYTRRKAKIQVGDGPDQRGEVTIETVRDYDSDDVDADAGSREAADDRGFAEWQLELDRTTRSLRRALGLEDEEGEP